jgi:hypothetical protein
MTTTHNHKSWNEADRQNFADRNFLKAKTIPNKKREARRKACRRASWD